MGTIICWILFGIMMILIIFSIYKAIEQSIKPIMTKYRIVELHFSDNYNKRKVIYICEKSINNGPFRIITWEVGYPGGDPLDATRYEARFANLNDAISCIGTTDFEFVVIGKES